MKGETDQPDRIPPGRWVVIVLLLAGVLAGAVSVVYWSRFVRVTPTVAPDGAADQR